MTVAVHRSRFTSLWSAGFVNTFSNSIRAEYGDCRRSSRITFLTSTYRVPVPIHLLAQRLNLTLEAAALGDKVSGMLVVEGDQGAIGYNSAHARVRQRFTISHEIAHYLLHARRSGKAQLFIDKQVTYRRDDQSSE